MSTDKIDLPKVSNPELDKWIEESIKAGVTVLARLRATREAEAAGVVQQGSYVQSQYDNALNMTARFVRMRELLAGVFGQPPGTPLDADDEFFELMKLNYPNMFGEVSGEAETFNEGESK